MPVNHVPFTPAEVAAVRAQLPTVFRDPPVLTGKADRSEVLPSPAAACRASGSPPPIEYRRPRTG